ncbi:MAG: serine/threonine-protein kinase [Gemmataceae bacterium]
MAEISLKQDCSLEALVGQAADEFLRRQRAGERPDVEEYAARYPRAADLLRRVLSSLELIGLSRPRAGEGCGEPPLLGELGDFRLLREVGRGGMGVVYEAEQISLRRRVALKVLPFAATMDARQLQRFHNEARAAAGLHHEHIVPVYGVGCERGVHYFAMQFIDGLTLAEVIARHNAAGEPTSIHVAGAGASTARPAATEAPRDAAYFRRVAEWGIQTAEALEHAHALGIVHRDIKPGNLLVDGRGKLWVTDFGLARTAADSNLTMSGDLVGTLRYMSPEQAMARHGLVDHRTDVYSLGTTLYELLSLKPAVGGEDRQEVLRNIAFEEPICPRKIDTRVPVDLETVVLKAMAKDPRERYPTAGELADDLRRVLEDQPVRAKRPGLVRRIGKLARRHKAVVAASTTGLLLALTVLAGSVGWAAGEARARRAETARVVGTALDDAKAFLERDKPYEALDAALRAEGLWQQGGEPVELQRPITEMTRDIRLLIRLELARLSGAAVRGLGFDALAEDQEYEKAFREDGLDLLALDPAEAAGQIRQRDIVAQLSAHLDHWTLIRGIARGVGDPSWQKLLALARGVEPDKGRDRVRHLLFQQDRKALKQMLRQGQLESIPAFLKCDMRMLLEDGAEIAEWIALIRREQQRRPDDFWLNHSMAWALGQARPPRLEEAVGFYRAAVALRPRSPGAVLNVGVALSEQGKVDEAIACFNEAVRLQPDFAATHNNLGVVLADMGKSDEALACYKEAIRLKSDFAEAHNNLGSVLAEKGKLGEAITSFKEAIRLEPDYADAHTNLGGALMEKGEGDKATTSLKEAIRLKPDLAEAHHDLGEVLRDQGRFTESLAAHRRAHELGSKQSGWRHPSAQAVRDAERLVELDRKLPSVLKGDQRPADAAEAAYLAAFCLEHKRKPAAAARLFADALASDPRLAEDPGTGLRYNAACAAAQAGCGVGQDAGTLGEMERLRWRRQALTWLDADLRAWRRSLEREPAKARPTVTGKMRHWLADADFTGVRGPEALARLPHGERNAWAKLWAGVADLLKRAEGPKARDGPPRP